MNGRLVVFEVADGFTTDFPDSEAGSVQQGYKIRTASLYQLRALARFGRAALMMPEPALNSSSLKLGCWLL